MPVCPRSLTDRPPSATVTGRPREVGAPDYGLGGALAPTNWLCGAYVVQAQNQASETRTCRRIGRRVGMTEAGVSAALRRIAQGRPGRVRDS
jgi:hypothetical protein